MRIHQHPLFLAVAYGFAVVGFSSPASAQMEPIVRPIVVGTFLRGNEADPLGGQVCTYAEEDSDSIVIGNNGTPLTIKGKQLQFRFPADVRCPKTVPIWHAAGAQPDSRALLGLHDYMLNPKIYKEKHHLCEYYLDDDQLAYWRSRHPNAPRPRFEAVVPVGRQCPVPPDDFTPLDPVTETMAATDVEAVYPVFTNCKANMRDALAKIAPVGSAISRSSPEYASIESKFESCLAAGGVAAAEAMRLALIELPELTRSRHFAPGVTELSLGTQMGGVCWQVQINGGIPIDQYLCIDPTKGVIYVGMTGTNPPQKVPLSQWRAAHTGFTFHEQPVLLPVEPLDPSRPGASSIVENIPDAPAYAQARGQNSENPKIAMAPTQVRVDPQHPLRIGGEWYPDASRRAKEEGRCIVRITVGVDGRVSDEMLLISSGSPRLDEACLKAFHDQRMIPATENGNPVERTLAIPIDWKL